MAGRDGVRDAFADVLWDAGSADAWGLAWWEPDGAPFDRPLAPGGTPANRRVERWGNDDIDRLRPETLDEVPGDHETSDLVGASIDLGDVRFKRSTSSLPGNMCGRRQVVVRESTSCPRPGLRAGKRSVPDAPWSGLRRQSRVSVRCECLADRRNAESDQVATFRSVNLGGATTDVRRCPPVQVKDSDASTGVHGYPLPVQYECSTADAAAVITDCATSRVISRGGGLRWPTGRDHPLFSCGRRFRRCPPTSAPLPSGRRRSMPTDSGASGDRSGS